jgi:Uma2 family endonuclease
MGAVFTPTRTIVTVKRFQDMVAAGVWRDDERIELIDGEIVDMAPIGGAHAWGVSRIADLLRPRVGERAYVWNQSPVVLGERSQPQPDLALLRPKAGGYGLALPTAEDVLLLIEVSDTTLDYDRGVKLRLYASSGIHEYWIVDLQAERVEVYRRPEALGYASQEVVSGDDRLTVAALPGVAMRTGDCFAH